MKLRMLAVAAGFVVVPAIASAQTPTDTTTKMPMATTSAPMTMAAKDSSLEPKPVPPSDGTTCPWGCPTSAGAAGLTGPQFLALQQELRDRKCGTNHVTGRLDAATRTAIRNCPKKLGVANNAGAVLVAMDVGYSASDIGIPATLSAVKGTRAVTGADVPALVAIAVADICHATNPRPVSAADFSALFAAAL